MLTLYYSAQTNGFSSPVPWAITPQNYNNDPSGYSPGTTAAALIDINGDGLPDWVTQPSSGTLNHFNVQTNSGSGFIGPAGNDSRPWSVICLTKGDSIMKAGLIAVGSIFALAIAYNIYLHNIHNAEISRNVHSVVYV